MSLIALKTAGITLPERNVDYIMQRYDEGKPYWTVTTVGMDVYRELQEPSQHLVTAAAIGSELWLVYQSDDEMTIHYRDIERSPTTQRLDRPLYTFGY